MINIIDTWNLLNQLYAVGAPVDINSDWTDEEFHNYVIHQFDVFVLSDWSFAAETSTIVHAQRHFRKQKWTTAWRPK